MCVIYTNLFDGVGLVVVTKAVVIVCSVYQLITSAQIYHSALLGFMTYRYILASITSCATIHGKHFPCTSRS